MGMVKEIVCLLALTTMVSGNVFQNLISNIKNKETNELSGLCSVNIDRPLFRCEVEPNNDLVPEGTICSFQNENDLHLDTTAMFICDNGFWTNVDHISKGTTSDHRINKRFLGIILGVIGAAVGGALTGAVACHFLCERPVAVQSSPPNQPPTIICQTVEDKTNSRLENTVVVEWNEPTATDPESGNIPVKRGDGYPASGSRFKSGRHSIIYTAEDDAGNKDACSITFEVTVIHCYYDSSLYVENGRTNCNPPSLIYGAVCTSVCDTGYEFSSSVGTSKTCEKDGLNGVWQPTESIICTKKKCQPPPEVCNGELKCSGEDYLSVCYLTCHKGFSADHAKSGTCDGDTWVGLDNLPPCKDIQPPEFTLCPEGIHQFADSSGTAQVFWPNPEVDDNSYNSEPCGQRSPVELLRTSGKESGATFEIGIHEIKYQATDSSGNTAQCRFYVMVEELSCDPLFVTDQFLLVRCPNGHTLGAVCFFNCFLSYNLIGDDNVTCEKDLNDEGRAFWKWSNSTESYCEKLTCPDLPPPVGGALACSEALGNKICTMSCSDQYQVSKDTPIEYVCSDEQVWIQGIPPNCTDRVHPSNAYQPGELFYYYSGDCSKSSVQEKIKENFVDNMKQLEGTDGWQNICPAYCTVEGVTVTCGPSNGRKKRSVESSHHFWKRETNQITLTFNVVSQWDTTKDLWGNDDNLNVLTEFLGKMVQNGTFDYPETTTGRLVFGWVDYSCPVGQEALYDKEGSCVGCSPGKYLENGECLYCPKGSYQDKEYQINCTMCPLGQSTELNGSVSFSECKDVCAAGSYSSTGVVPCTPCQFGYYQTLNEATACIKCASGKYTETTGSSKESDCQAPDVTFTTDNASIILPHIQASIHSYSVGFFLKCPNNTTGRPLISSKAFKWVVGSESIISIGNYSFFHNINKDVELRKWVQLSFTFQQSTKELKVYGKGKLITSKIFSSASDQDSTIPAGSLLEIKAMKSACSFTGFFLVAEVLSENTILTLQNTCQPTISNAVYTINDVFISKRTGTDITKSRCDAIDECASNPCGWGNSCIDEYGGYKCICSDGYSGMNCQIPPDFCLSNDCANGATCENHFANYTCLCSTQYTGVHCESKIIHGNWGSWQDLSECSTSCGGGTKEKVRFCNNPAPDAYGTTCIGSNTTLEDCNTEKCPECPTHLTIYQYKNSFNCTTIGESISCTVSCQDGYTFVKDYFPLDSYECGPNTAYEWNARPPPCTSVNSPRAIRTTSVVQYEINCEEEEQISSSLSLSLNELQCVQNSSCTVETRISGCSNMKRKKRSISTVEATIQLYSSISESSDLQIEEFFANNIVSPALNRLLQVYNDMESSLQQLNNTDVLTLDVNGNLLTADLSTLAITKSLTCPDGTVEEELLCAECPFGTYWSNGLCVMCPIGYFQNVSGQTKCMSCPLGYTTRYLASRNETECSVQSQTETNTRTPEEHISDKKVIVIVVTVVIVVVACITVAIFAYRSYLRKHKRYDRSRSILSIASINQVTPKIDEDGIILLEGEYNVPDDVRYTKPPVSSSFA